MSSVCPTSAQACDLPPALSDEQLPEQVMQWLALLERWNRVFNLTAIPEPRRIAQLVHSSVAALPYILPGRVADIGSGSGVPGIPLALFAPTNRYDLIDSSGKKIRFLNQCRIRLNLTNVRVLHTRVQELRGQCYDTIISRAFASADALLAATRHLANEHTRWLLFKHDETQAHTEIEQVREAQCTLHRLTVPSLAKPIFLIQAQR